MTARHSLNRAFEWLLNGMTLLVLAAAGLGMFSPNMSVVGYYQRWSKSREVSKRLASGWDQLAQRARLDSIGTGVTLVEVGDYECPFCRKNHPELQAFMHEHPEIGISYLHLPLPGHRSAAGAARASICAEEQGRFRDVHSYLFETSQWQTDTTWIDVARSAHVPDLARFMACLKDARTTDRLNRDIKLAQELGVTGTPTFLTRQNVDAGFKPDTALVRLLGMQRTERS